MEFSKLTWCLVVRLLLHRVEILYTGVGGLPAGAIALLPGLPPLLLPVTELLSNPRPDSHAPLSHNGLLLSFLYLRKVSHTSSLARRTQLGVDLCGGRLLGALPAGGRTAGLTAFPETEECENRK